MPNKGLQNPHGSGHGDGYCPKWEKEWEGGRWVFMRGWWCPFFSTRGSEVRILMMLLRQRAVAQRLDRRWRWRPETSCFLPCSMVDPASTLHHDSAPTKRSNCQHQKLEEKKIHFYRLSTSKTPTCGYCEGEYWLTVGRIVWFRANCPLKLPFSGSWVEEEKSSIFSNGKKELERGWSCFGLTFPLEVLIPALQSASSWVVEPSAVSKLLLLDPEIPKLKSKLCSDPPAEKKSKISEILTERKSWSCTILRFWPVVFSSFS